MKKLRAEVVAVDVGGGGERVLRGRLWPLVTSIESGQEGQKCRVREPERFSVHAKR